MEKSKSKEVIYTQFFVKKVGIISHKRILAITNHGLTLHTIPYDSNKKESILYTEINAIEFSKKNLTDLTVLHGYACWTLNCNERNLCLHEIYKAWDKNPHIKELAPEKYDVHRLIIPDMHEFYIECTMKIYRSHIELIHDKLKIPKNLHEKIIVLDKAKGFKLHETLIIPFFMIKNIQKHHNGFLLSMDGSGGSFNLGIYELEKNNAALSSITNACKKFAEIDLPVTNENLSDIPNEFIQEDENQDFYFSSKAYKVLESGHMMMMEIALSDSQLLEIDIGTRVIMQKYNLEAVTDFVRMNSGLAGVQVQFIDSNTLTYVPPATARGLFLSNIFTIANWKRNSPDSYRLQSDFISSFMPNMNKKVFGWDHHEIDNEFEVELIKKFSYPSSDEDFYNALREFNQNASLLKFTDNETKPLQFLIQLFCKNAKIIMTKEFITFWELYQIRLNNLYNYQFDGESPEEPHIHALRTIEEKLKNSTTKFQFEQSSGHNSIELNMHTLPIILLKAEELLKAIIIMISSKALFREITSNKREQEFYEDFVIQLSNFIDSSYPIFSHLAGCFFRALCRFNTPTEKKLEAQNKHFILGKKINLVHKITENLAKKVLVRRKDQRELENYYILSILACLRILKTFVFERKDSTNDEDLQEILKYLNTPYYFAIFNFLSRYRSIPILYNTTILINSIFQNCPNRETYKIYQNKVLNNSTLVLLHIVHAISSISVLQRKISVIFLSNMFVDNANCCALVCRLFPKNLFRKVESSSNDISKWALQQWEQLFDLAIKDFNTPTEQWSEACREELIKKLISIDRDVISKFKSSANIQDLIDNTSAEAGEHLIPIRWNHEELEIKYQVLQPKLLTWKYYLTSLLHDGEKPKLTTTISHGMKFWNELNVKFIGSSNQREMRIILKVMILLYEQNYADIRDLNTMLFWLKCLRDIDYSHCKYLILQLLYSSFTVGDPMIVKFNIKKFIDSDGLRVLADVLGSLYFPDDHNILIQDEIDSLREVALQKDIVYNYTKLKFKKQGYNESLEKSCMIFYILNIYRTVLQRPTDKTAIDASEKVLYPIPNAKNQIIDHDTIRVLLNIILVRDDDLVIELLEFLSSYLCDKYTYRSLAYNSNLYELILYNVTSRTLPHRVKLVLKLYQKIAEETPPEDNPIKECTEFTFEKKPAEKLESAINLFPLIRHLPKHFIWILINYGIDNFVQIYEDDQYESPDLIWNNQMRERVTSILVAHFEDYRRSIMDYAKQNPISSKEKVPLFAGGPAIIEYPNLAEEVSAGPIWLRVWIKKKFKTFSMSKENIESFILSLYSLLKNYNEQASKDFGFSKDLLIILKAHARAIKLYNLKKYATFPEIMSIASKAAELVAEWSYSPKAESEEDLMIEDYIHTIFKIIHHSISIPDSENANEFIKNDGFDIFIKIFGGYIRRITVNDDQGKSVDYYHDISMSFKKLKVLDLAVRIFRGLFEKVPNLLEITASEARIKIFLDLQRSSKIPLVLFEKIVSDKKPEVEEDDIIVSEIDENKENKASIFEAIDQDPTSSESDAYIMKIFAFLKHMNELFSRLSLDVISVIPFIQSGIAWRLIEYLTYYHSRQRFYEKIDDPNFQSMLDHIEKLGHILRNILIVSNEIYTMKMTNLGARYSILTSKEKSPQLIMILNKIEGSDRNILAKFHESVIIIFGKRLLQYILTDYYEPTLNPEEKDQNSVLKFLNAFSTSLVDPSTYWNESTRKEAKDLMRSQILGIINSKNRNPFNKIENFQYTSHKEQLIIDEVFITIYNADPTWKIPNPPEFLIETLKSVEKMRLEAEAMISEPVDFEKQQKARFCLTRLIEAMNSIANVTHHHGFEDVILYEENLTQVGHLLEDPIFQRNDPIGNDLRSTVLDILVTLSNKLQGALKIIQNVTIVKFIIIMIRTGLASMNDLVQKIIAMFCNIVNYENLKKPLVNYGIVVLLLETTLKKEVFSKSLRADAFKLFMNIAKTHDISDPVQDMIEFFFPVQIHEILVSNLPTLEIITILDDGYDSLEIMWTPLMRYEILYTLQEECELIQSKWEKLNSGEIRIIESRVFWDSVTTKNQPQFCELKENLAVDKIFLCNYNKEPSHLQNANFSQFIENLSKCCIQSLDKYDQLIDIAGHQEEKARATDEVLTTMTSLLLILDTFMTKTKREALKEIEEDKIEGSVPLGKGAMIQETLQFNEKALVILSRGLKIFEKEAVHADILATVLELAFVIIDNPKGLASLEANHIIQFLSAQIKHISDEKEKKFSFVEERLLLYLLVKAMTKDPALLHEAYETCLNSLKDILEKGKEEVKDLVKLALATLVQDHEKGREIYEFINSLTSGLQINVHRRNTTGSSSSTINTSFFYFNIKRSIWKEASSPFPDNKLMDVIRSQEFERFDLPLISSHSCQKLPYSLNESFERENIIKTFMKTNFKIE